MTSNDAQGKILLIEDDAMLGNIAADKFRANGFTVIRAEGGRDGIAMALRENPDLVLLDVIMPGMNGMDVLKAMKSDARLRDIPVVLFSNIAQEKEVAEAKALGAAEYLVKVDYTPPEIVERVRQILNVTRMKSPEKEKISNGTSAQS